MAELRNGNTVVYIQPALANLVADSYSGLETCSSTTGKESSLRSDGSTAHRADHRMDSKKTDASLNKHIVTITVNQNTNKQPSITSVQLKNDLKTFSDFYNKKHNTSVRLNVDTDYSNKENYEKDLPYINYNTFPANMVMSSGQCSPSDTLDSGTCSDLDGTPPPLPKKKTSRVNGQKKVTIGNNSDDLYEDNDSSVSYDSLNSSELSGSIHMDESDKQKNNGLLDAKSEITKFLQKCLLDDIREKKPKRLNHEIIPQSNGNKIESMKNEKTDKSPIISESLYEERYEINKGLEKQFIYDADKYYNFHLNEKVFEKCEVIEENEQCDEFDECFAGFKDLKGEVKSATIKSSKGTIRGVKNRVRAGIATFLQIQSTGKNYKEKDANKVVLYTTTMGIVRSTYQRCMLVKKILRNLLVKFEERDVFMSLEYQDEIKDRMETTDIVVPQLFLDGQYIGDAEVVEKLNESGELRKMLKPYKSPDACNTCQVCGGFRLLPCKVCNGSKKSLHRNNFTAEFVALKCMNCDEVGLVRCEACS